MTTSKPCLITDFNRTVFKSVSANSLQDLIQKSIEAFNLVEVPNSIRIVLDEDGTEISENDYFLTLDENCKLMLLNGLDQKWSIPIPMCFRDDYNQDELDAFEQIGLINSLLYKLQHRLTHIGLLTNSELELLTEMDIDRMVQTSGCKKSYLETLNEVAGRLLTEKRDVQDGMDLMELYASRHPQ